MRTTLFQPVRSLAITGILSLVALSGLAGCSDNDTTANADGNSASTPASGGTSGSPATGADGLTTITVDAPPTTAQAAVYLGAKGGEFADAGLDVTVNTHTAADSPLVGLMSGTFPIVWTSAADLLVAQEKGLPVVILADSDLGQPGTTQVIVKEDSPIKELADFDGANIGIPGPTSSCAVTIPGRAEGRRRRPDVGHSDAGLTARPGHGARAGRRGRGCTPDPFLSIIGSQVPSRT